MLSNLPAEILLRITYYLSDTEKMSLALTQPRVFEKLTPFERSLNFQNNYDIHVSILKEYVTRLASQITEVNFSHCYWIEPYVLQEIILCLPSVQKLQLRGTKLKSKHLLNIIKSCQKLTYLSVSFDGLDSNFWNQEPSYNAHEGQTYHQNCIFYDSKDTLAKLKILQLYGDCFTTVMFTILLSFCTHLENLHIEFSSRYLDILTEKVFEKTLLNLKELSKKQPSYSYLKSLTCISNGNLVLYVIPTFLQCLLLAKTTKLDAFWVPEICRNEFVARLANFSEFPDLLTNLKGDYEIRHLINQVPHLKLLSCFCDHPGVFPEFARNHGELEELRLKVLHYDIFLGGGRLKSGFEFLPRLKRLCISPGLLSGSELTQLTQSCVQLEELEIADWSSRRPSYNMKSDALSSITKCSNLKCLTLSGINASGPSLFLLNILSQCSKLQSLRLVNVTGQQIVNQMICSISDARKLADFRLEMHKFDDLGPLLQSMSQMASLRRWVILVRSHQQLDILNSVAQEWRSSLVLACLIIPNAIPRHASSFQIISKHPAFRWCFGTSVRDAESLPEVHYDDLIAFGSNVCERPIV